MEIRELTNQDHDVLGAEYCSGYTDVHGKWNTGFDCPKLGNGEIVYCCGTVFSKYCCTRRDQQTATGVSQAMILGSALGSVLVLILVSLVSCLVCRRCVPYRRAHTSLSGGPLYNMPCSSTVSGVANMCSFSGQTSVATTPHDVVSDPHHVLLDLDTSRDSTAPHRSFVSHRSFGPLPSEPPPPYSGTDVEPINHCLRDSSTISHTTTSFSAHAPSSQAQPAAYHQQEQHSSALNNGIGSPNALYWSTKF